MAHVLRLTDYTVTVNLAGGTDDITLLNYVPTSPQLSPVEAAAWAMEDGGRVTTVTRRNVTEPCDVTIEADTTAEIRTALNSIEVLLRQAEEAQRYGMADRVYVEFQPGGTGTVYRSEVYYGKVDVSSDALGLHWHAPALQSRITWRRAFYWEAASQTELSLANGSGSGTGGITVYNHNDSGHDNWVDIDGGDVGGVIPTPIYITMENTYNDSDRLYTARLAHNVFSTPSTFPHILEGEDADYVYLSPSPTASGLASEGFYQPCTWTGDNWVNTFRWTLSTSLLNAAKGGFFRVLMKLSNSITAGHWVRMQITFPTGTPLTVVYQAPDVSLPQLRLTDLGVVQIPPWLPGTDDYIAVDLTFYQRFTGGSSIYIDYLQLTPLDGFRRYEPRGYGLPYGYTLHDDGPNGLLWSQSGTAKLGYFRAYGDPIQLWPGKDQRLYLQVRDTGGSDIARTTELRVYYRPRRLTL